MEIINESELHTFARRHSNARKPISGWIEVTNLAVWHSFGDVRESFRSADYVNKRVIFNIGGNNFRVITKINYRTQRVFILEVMTHAEYDRWKA